jgi:hypothetical protein
LRNVQLTEERGPDATSVLHEPPSPIRVGVEIKSRYQLVQELGEGGMGRVFKACDRNKVEANDRNPFIAIKILGEDFARHPDAFIALQRESRRAQEVVHPNVIQVHDFDRDGSTVFMTMEYLEGRSLEAALRADFANGMSVDQVMPIVTAVGSALSAAHERKIVHSDLKPSNVFLCRQGPVKVLDFGISRHMHLAGSNTGTETVFDPAKRLGALTPAYASLEQLNGEEPDPRDDLYAFGCLTYEALTGRHPFAHASADRAMASGLTPARVPSLSRLQWEALRRALAFKREQRTRSMAEFLREFTPPGWLRQHRFAIAAVAVVLFAATAAGGYKAISDYIEERMMGRGPDIPKVHPTLTAEQRQQIDESLFLAQDYLKDAKLELSSENLAYVLSEGANNVAQILDSVLAIDPADEKAWAMKQQIAGLYADKARQLVGAGQKTAAISMVRNGLKILPHDRQLFRLQQELCDGPCAP